MQPGCAASGGRLDVGEDAPAMAEAPPNTIRIFLSSPGDVTAERDATAALVEALNADEAVGAAIELVRWEDAYYSAAASFQQQIASPADCDLMVLILWARIGTPLPATSFARADGSAYRSGTEFEFEAALDAARATGRPDIFVYRKTAPPQFAAGDDQAAVQWRDLQAFWSRWFVDGQGHCIAGYHDFPSADAFEHKLSLHLRRWLRDRRQVTAASWPAAKGSPFRGLEAFEAEHAPVFFGRQAALRQVRRRLAHATARGCTFLLIVGRSGVGKSSFVKAGLIPALCRGDDDSRGDAAVALLRADSGPVALLAALRDALRLAELPLDAEPEAAAAAVGRALADGRRLILYLDQFEGLFGLEPEARQRLVALAAALAARPGVTVVATLRSDLYRHLQEMPALVALKEAGASYDLLPPSPEDIRGIVRGPAAAAGLTYEFDPETGVGLDEVLVRAAGQPDVLPLLEFTLDELYKRRAPAEQGQGALTFAAYRELGGLEGAIASRAEGEFARLDAAAQAALPAVLRACVTAAGAGDERLIAQSVPLELFPPGTPERRLVDAFVEPRARLLVVVADGDSQAVRLAHEALLTHWPRAVAQLAMDRQLILARARLAEQAARWQEAESPQRDSLLLAPGLPLGEAEAVLERDGQTLPPAMTAFIKASAAANLSRLEREAATAQRQVRRARAIAGVIGALGITTAAAAVVGFQFWREAEVQAGVAEERAAVAEAQQRTAERNLELAINAADGLVSSVANRLRDLAGVRSETIAAILAEAEALMRTIEKESEQVPPTLRHRQAMMYWSFAETYQSLGDMAKARSSSEQARGMLEELTADPAAANDWRADLVMVMEQQGRILMTQDDAVPAVALFRDAIAIAEPLVEVDPGSIEWRRRLAQVYMALGDGLAMIGDWAGARAAQEADMQLTVAMLQENPDNATLARDLGISMGRAAALSRLEGRLGDALLKYQAALALYRDLSVADPENTRLMFDIGYTQAAIGEILTLQGRLEEAAAAYRENLELDRELAALDPGNTHWTRSVAIDLKQLGTFAMQSGDLVEAEVRLEESHVLFLALAESDPLNWQWQRDVLTSFAQRAQLLTLQGRLQEAGTVFTERLERARALVAVQPESADMARELSYAIDDYVEHLLGQGDVDQGHALLLESLGILQRLAEAQPENASIAGDLSYTWQDLANVEFARGDGAAAVAALEAAIEIGERLSAANPENGDLARARSVIYSDLGWVHLQLGDVEAARAAYEQDFAIAARLAAREPDHLDWQRDLALSHASMGSVAEKAGDRATAEAHYRESVAIVERLVERAPGTTAWQRDLIYAHIRLGLLLGFDRRYPEARESIAAARAIAEERLQAMPGLEQAASDLQLAEGAMAGIDELEAGDQGEPSL